MKRAKVTMKDIAKELNLSLATVSYALNHSEKEKISHDTRIKVMETAKRMGYVPNQTAKSLTKSHSNLLLPDTKRIIISNRQKAQVAITILRQLLSLDYDENSRTQILLLPDPPAELGL